MNKNKENLSRIISGWKQFKTKIKQQMNSTSCQNPVSNISLGLPDEG